MQITHLVVDGNNLLHAWRPRAELARDFAGARWALARLLDQAAGAIGAELVLIFDGSVGGRDEALTREGIDVRYATPEIPADTIIERMVRDAAQPQAIRVVSSDLGVQRTSAAGGAEVVSCPQFLEWVQDQQRLLRERLLPPRGKRTGQTLGDFFPPPQAP